MKKWILRIKGDFENYRFKSFFWKSFRLLIIALVTPLLLMLTLVFAFSQQIMQHEIEVANLRMAETTEHIFSSIYKGSVSSMKSIFGNEDVQRVLSLDTPVHFSEFAYVRHVANLLESNQKTDFITSVCLLDENTDYLISSDGYASRVRSAQTSELSAYGAHTGASDRWVRRSASSFYDADKRTDVITMFRTMTFGDCRGVLAINISKSKLDALFEGLSKSYEKVILLADKQKNVLYESGGETGIPVSVGALPVKKMTGAEGILPAGTAAGKLMLVYKRIPGSPWLSVIAVKYRAYADDILTLKSFMIITIVLGIGMALILSLLLAERLTRPIISIVSYIDGISTSRPEEADNELSYILMRILHLYDDNKLLEEETLKRCASLRTAQAHALQAQLTPHFLNNTLQSISWMMIDETGNEDSPAAAALIQLSELARDIMENHESKTTLQEETASLYRYISIQKLRYLDTIEFAFNIPAALRDAVVPRFYMQPLVENAIKYMHRGRILITVYQEGQVLHTLVVDNGSGMSPQELDRYNRSFAEDGGMLSLHIGLGNLNQRIRLLYGDAYGLRLFETDGGGLSVDVKTPFCQKNAEHQDETYKDTVHKDGKRDKTQ